MLTSLLPGLRELRPPLAAGALWLVVAFLAARAMTQGDVHVEALEPVVDSFAALTASIDETWGVGVVLTFAAFLIGGLSHAFLTDLLQSQLSGVSPKGARSIHLIARQGVGGLVDALDLDRLTKVRVSSVDPVLMRAFQVTVRGRLDEATGARSTRRTDNAVVASLRSPSPLRRPREDDKEERDFVLEEGEAESLRDREWRSGVRAYLEREVPREIEAELPSVATRLIGKEQALFDQYDRLRAEAEFRVSLVPPLGALGLAVPFSAFPWVSVLVALLELALVVILVGVVLFSIDREDLGWAVLVITLGLAIFFPGGVVLLDQEPFDIAVAFLLVVVMWGLAVAVYAQGMKIHCAAGDLLADAIFVGRVDSPLLERLHRTGGVPSEDGAS